MTRPETRARALWKELYELRPDYDGFGVPEPPTKWLEVVVRHFREAMGESKQ